MRPPRAIGSVLPVLAALLTLALPSAAQFFQGIPRMPSPLLVDLAVVEVISEPGESTAAIEAEIDAERDLWSDEEGRSPGLAVLAAFRGPTVLHYTNRLELSDDERVAVTLLDRDRRRVRVLVVEEHADEEPIERILNFRLARRAMTLEIRPTKAEQG